MNVYEMEVSDAFEIAAQKYEEGKFREAQRYADFGLGILWRINGE